MGVCFRKIAPRRGGDNRADGVLLLAWFGCLMTHHDGTPARITRGAFAGKNPAIHGSLPGALNHLGKDIDRDGKVG
jgi:hypothetical protein